MEMPPLQDSAQIIYNVIRLQFQLPRWGAFKKADALASEKPICQSDGFCVSSEHTSLSPLPGSAP